MFSQVDKSWKDIMRQVQDRPNALKCATQTGMLETLQACNSSLEKIQKCLEVGYFSNIFHVRPVFYVTAIGLYIPGILIKHLNMKYKDNC